MRFSFKAIALSLKSAGIKKFAPLLFIFIFGIIGIIGYTTESSSLPIRVLFKTKGGDVIFQHEAHSSDYQCCKCQDCHHNIQNLRSRADWKCRTCHHAGGEYENICEDRMPHPQCVGAQCVQCHTRVGMDPKDCAFCHRK